jgi:hypothetical protein
MPAKKLKRKIFAKNFAKTYKFPKYTVLKNQWKRARDIVQVAERLTTTRPWVQTQVMPPKKNQQKVTQKYKKEIQIAEEN